MPARASRQSKKRKKRGCSGASVAIGWALAQGGTLAASPKRTEMWEAFRTAAEAGVPRHHAEAPPRTGSHEVIIMHEIW